MPHDQGTLMSALTHLKTYHSTHPSCFTASDLNDLKTLERHVNHILGAAHRNELGDPKYHHSFDRARQLMKHLQFRQRAHAEKMRWEEELIRQYKYNDRHKPAGSPNSTGGEFDVKPGGGGGVPPSGERPGFRRIGQVADNLHNPVQNDVGGGLTDARPPRSLTGSERVVRFVAKHEKFTPGIYPDQGGRPTIGYGHLVQGDESFPREITEEEALALLQQDMKESEKILKNNVHVPLTQNQFDALASLTFNAGARAFHVKDKKNR